MALFAEGIESLKLACSLVLLIPAVGVILLGARRRALVPVWIAVVALVAWLRFTAWWPLDASGPVHVLAGVAVLGLAVAAWKLDRMATDVAATAGVAIISAWTWVPCVGRELGGILNDAPSAPWPELAPTVVYFAGLFLPLIVVAAASVAWPDVAARFDRQATRTIGLGVLAVVGGLVALTLLDDLAGELARRSSF